MTNKHYWHFSTWQCFSFTGWTWTAYSFITNPNQKLNHIFASHLSLKGLKWHQINVWWLLHKRPTTSPGIWLLILITSVLLGIRVKLKRFKYFHLPQDDNRRLSADPHRRILISNLLRILRLEKNLGLRCKAKLIPAPFLGPNKNASIYLVQDTIGIFIGSIRLRNSGEGYTSSYEVLTFY